MAYTTATDLALMLPRAYITASSTPDYGGLATIAAEVSAELDAAAALAGYVVPIPTTATTAYAQMTRYAKDGALAETLSRMFFGDAETLGRTPASGYRKAYEDALKRIAGGDLPLVGATPDTSGTTRLLPRGSGNPSPIMQVDRVF